jgi:hypothetical protein
MFDRYGELPTQVGFFLVGFRLVIGAVCDRLWLLWGDFDAFLPTVSIHHRGVPFHQGVFLKSK